MRSPRRIDRHRLSRRVACSGVSRLAASVVLDYIRPSPRTNRRPYHPHVLCCLCSCRGLRR
jgi:hypothetical protein